MYITEKVSDYARRMFDIPKDFEVIIFREPKKKFPALALGSISRLLLKHKIHSWCMVCNQKITVAVWTEKVAQKAIEILDKHLNLRKWTHYFWSLDSICYCYYKDNYIYVNSADDKFSEPTKCTKYKYRTVPMFDWKGQRIRIRDVKKIDKHLIPKI